MLICWVACFPLLVDKCAFLTCGLSDVDGIVCPLNDMVEEDASNTSLIHLVNYLRYNSRIWTIEVYTSSFVHVHVIHPIKHFTVRGDRALQRHLKELTQEEGLPFCWI
jgi:hypothetical protein